MNPQFSTSAVGAAAAVLLIAVVLLYRAALPKPIPGVPYKKGSEKRLLGDASDSSQILKWRNETQEVFSYMRKLATDLNSPVFQLFMRPMGRPWVIITDFREAYDICTNRREEFDRSAFTGEVFGPIVPNSHIQFATDDLWRSHRQLLRDTMSPSFVASVIGPVIHRSASGLVSLWKTKARLAGSQPFDAEQDLARCLVDLIVSSSFGYDVKSLRTHEDSLSQKVVKGDNDSPMVFIAGEDTEACTSLITLASGVGMAIRSPFPKIVLPLALRFLPSFASAQRYTHDMISEQASAAWNKFSKAIKIDRDEQVTSAMDLLVLREVQMARKEGRESRLDLPVVRDELLAFLFAGQETTGSTIGWSLKYLAINQDIQKKMREELRGSHKRAAQIPGGVPTSQEIVDTHIPYVEAFIAENHRFAVTISCMIRHTIKDAVVLGHVIPKGSDIFCLTNGPSYQSPSAAVDESLRSKSSQEAKDKFGVWDEANVSEFRPERWLEMQPDGELRFNPFAGPSNPFGVGPRACFGIKWANLIIKTMVTQIVWNFDIQETPENLAGFEASDGASHRAQKTFVRLVALQ
ncbi:Cytochrome P450 1A1-like protein 1 [Seiridium cupressi]